MICPKCNKNTPAVLSYCEHCKAELNVYHSKREENLQIKGSRIFLITSFVSTILSFAFLLFLIISFFAGYFLFSLSTGPLIYIITPLYFLMSLGGFLKTFFSKKTWKKKNKL